MDRLANVGNSRIVLVCVFVCLRLCTVNFVIPPAWIVPVLYKFTAWMCQTELLPMDIIHVRFEFVNLPDNLGFYECRFPGCTGCGCPVIESIVDSLSQEIQQHLYLHVILRH